MVFIDSPNQERNWPLVLWIAEASFKCMHWAPLPALSNPNFSRTLFVLSFESMQTAAAYKSGEDGYLEVSQLPLQTAKVETARLWSSFSDI